MSEKSPEEIIKEQVDIKTADIEKRVGTIEAINEKIQKDVDKKLEEIKENKDRIEQIKREMDSMRSIFKDAMGFEETEEIIDRSMHRPQRTVVAFTLKKDKKDE